MQTGNCFAAMPEVFQQEWDTYECHPQHSHWVSWVFHCSSCSDWR